MMGGAGWSSNNGWLSGGSSCVTGSYHGLTTGPCGSGDQADPRRIRLGANDMHGVLPTELGFLRDLQHLDVHGNTLSGSIPTEIGRLTQLNQVALNANRLSGVLPTQIGLLTKLRLLNIYGNRISGVLLPLPASAVFIDVSNNSLSGTIPAMIPEDYALQHFSAHSNNLGGAINNVTLHSYAAKLTSRLYLHSNRISGTLPTQLGSLYSTNATGVTMPSLHSNRITGTVPSELGVLSRLSFPTLAYNSLVGNVPLELASSSSWMAVVVLRPPTSTHESGSNR